MMTRLLGPMLLAAVLPLTPVSTTPRVAAAEQSIVLAGGCFWGVEAVFEHMKGVKSAVSGYAGGTTTAPTYELVSSGRTGHAESVRVVFDPAQVSVEQLLEVFFMVAHNPTQLNRQGPDVGTQYRSAVFFSSPDQQRAAQAYVAALTQKRVYPQPVVTQVVPLDVFYPAESYHQGYLAQHPDQPYIVINDAPKLDHLKSAYPALYRATTPAE
jgi:peptide-methionine (S)-S-oxide reductase